MTDPSRVAARRSRRQIAFWTATAIVLAESVAGGAGDLARQGSYYRALIHLGYPSYFTDILGAAKLLAAAVLLVPGFPRLKEWAYAGIMINMVGAAVSHIAVGDGIGDIAPPATFAVIVLVSWLLYQAQLTQPPTMLASNNRSGLSEDQTRRPFATTRGHLVTTHPTPQHGNEARLGQRRGAGPAFDGSMEHLVRAVVIIPGMTKLT